MAAIKQRVKNLSGPEYFPYPLYIFNGLKKKNWVNKFEFT